MRFAPITLDVPNTPELALLITRYTDNDRPAIFLFDELTGEPYADLTVNLDAPTPTTPAAPSSPSSSAARSMPSSSAASPASSTLAPTGRSAVSRTSSSSIQTC